MTHLHSENAFAKIVYLLTTYETRAPHGLAAIRNDSRYSFGV